MRRAAVRLGCSFEAEDVLQDAWLKLAAVDGNRSVANAKGFVTTVTNNLVLSRLRSNKRRQAVDIALRVAVADHREERSPERTIMARDALTSVLLHLDRLAPRTRTIFIQHRLEHRSTGEIARIHRISDEAVLYHLRRATQQLRPWWIGDAEVREKI
jgi:RNA polymerase sigma factor (sigma-70 family)